MNWSDSYTHQSPLGFDEGPVLSVHLVVEAARVAQIVSGAVTSPQRSRRRAAVHALPTLCDTTLTSLTESVIITTINYRLLHLKND